MTVGTVASGSLCGMLAAVLRRGEFVTFSHDEMGTRYGKIVSETETELVVERVRKEVCENLFRVK